MKVGGKNSAKRRIQVRAYLANKVMEGKHVADPFETEESSVVVLKYDPPPIDSSKEEPPAVKKSSDDLLGENVDFDNADYLITVLKKAKKAK